MEKRTSPLSPTEWKENPYQEEWAEIDYLYSPDGVKEYPKHVCKMTYLLSKPFIKQFRTAVDIGCRIGEFTRYLHLDFGKVYAFDPNLWPLFSYNVNLAKVDHFQCALGDDFGEIEMFGGGHDAEGGGKQHIVPMFPLDAFDLKDVDYIKIDVEGFEKKVLLGAKETIARYNPLIVIEQNHVVIDGDKQYAAKDYLESIGYRQAAVDKRGWDFVMVRD